MDWVKAVVEWLKKIAGIVKLAVRLDQIEQRLEAIERNTLPAPTGLVAKDGVWLSVSDGNVYCPACAADWKWCPMNVRHDSIGGEYYRCPKCDAEIYKRRR
jgi:hypothetical protein